MAKTGVKFLHHVAEQLDVGIYFEANGHGTVLFSSHFKQQLQARISSVADSTTSTTSITALQRIKACVQLINPTVGDALSDLLLTLGLLHLMDMNISAWQEMYVELPSNQVKVKVADKSLLICTDDETSLLSPVILQDKIIQAASKVRQGRCFVRPSGTEDVVRIYAEACSMEEVDAIVREVTAALNDFFA
jgi:phosphoacetylglucosamine mutase